MIAIISYKQNQYEVTLDKEYKIALSDELTNGQEIIFDQVMLIDDGKETKVGTPLLLGSTVKGEVIDRVRGEKLTAMKFRPKKRYQRHLGHKQDFTLVKITAINA